MWTDIAISAGLSILTIAMAYLGVHVTLHPADSVRAKFWYKGGFVACATVAVVLVVWQGIRNGKSQSSFQATVKNAATAAQSAGQRIDHLEQEQNTEIARREQAEKDLALTVQSTGQSTRDGVVSDIKQSPIKVQLNGEVPEVAPLQTEDVRFVQSVDRSTHTDAPYGAQWTIQPNVPVMDVFRRLVKCNNPIKYIDFRISSGLLSFVGRTVNDSNGKDTGQELPLMRIHGPDPTMIIFDMKGSPGIPIFTPEQSLIVHVYSAVGPIVIKSIEVGPK